MSQLLKTTMIEREIAILKEQLNSLIERDLMASDAVLKLSCKLDRLIVRYFKLKHNNNA
jgi:hypothetical protein